MMKLVWALCVLTVVGFAGARFDAAADHQLFFDNLHWTAATSAAAMLAWLRVQRAELELRRAFAWIAAGFSFYAAGQMVWDIQTLSGWLPFPAFSDLFYLALGPMLVAGFWQVARVRLDATHFRMILLDTATLLISVLTASLALFLPHRGAYNGIQIAVVVAYPLLLMAPACFSIILFLALRIKPSVQSLLFPLGMTAYAFIWANWNLRFLLNEAGSGDWLNLSFSAVIILLGSAVYRLDLTAPASERWANYYELLLRSLPILVVVVAAVGVVLANANDGLDPIVPKITALGGGVAVLLAMIRQSDLLHAHIDLLATERLLRASDEEVHRSRNQLLQLNVMQKAILDGAHYSIVSTDKAGIIQTVNAAATRMLGYTAQELIGQLSPKIFHDYDEVTQRAVELSRELGRTVEPGFDVFVLKSQLDAAEERHWTYVRKDGSRFPVRLSVTALRDAQAEIYGYLGIASDISETIQAENARLLEERRYRTLIESAGDSILIWSDGYFIDCNSASLKTFACRREELVGHAPWDFSPPQQADGRDSKSKALEKINAALVGIPQFFEWQHCKANGELFDAEVTLNRLEGENSTFIAVVRDVTERKRAEREISNQKDLLQATMDALPGLFYVVGENGKIKAWNKTFQTVLNLQLEDIGAMQVLDNCHPEDRAAAGQKLKSIMETGKPDSLEARMISPTDGTITPVLASGSRAILDNERCVCVVAIDISERKEMELELQRFQYELILRNDSLRLINQLSNSLSSLLDVEKIATETMRILQEFGQADAASFHFLEPDGEHLHLAASVGFDLQLLKPYARMSLTSSASGRAIRERKVLVSFNSASDERIPVQGQQLLAQLGFTSVSYIPLIFNDNVIGCVNVFFNKTEKLKSLEADTLESIGKAVSLAITNARHVADLAHQAQHDSLTDLPNRKVLHEVFSQLFSVGINQNNTVALLLLDLDRFKEVNDTLGHHAGDLLLIEIGSRLTEVLANTPSLVCRLGGDEFAVLLYGLNSRDEAREFGKEISNALKKPFQIDAQNLQIGASIGIAYYPEHGDDSHALLRAADVAMYQSKRMGSELVVYHRQIDTHTPERLAIISELGQAISEHQLVMQYQPKWALDQNSVVGFEALVRWQHPQMGLLYPAAFVQLAELGEAIHPLTCAVLEMALAQQKQWKDVGLNYSVAVNLSARNLIDDRAVSVIEQLINKYGTQMGELELEITETALMHDPEFSADILHRIARLGVKLSIDDFGTGYSSLGYLRRLPISSLKIDRLFVKDMLQNEQDAIIVRSTIGLAHNLKLQVIAEGVEDESTLTALKDMGCDVVQGFHISKPQAWPQMQEWLGTTRSASEFSPLETSLN